MLYTLELSFIRYYRWIRFRHGHGVHSPFAFSFINDVVEEKNGYYAYMNILNQISRVQLYPYLSSRSQLKYLRLLYRISNYFRLNEIIQLGCVNGESLLYMIAPSPSLRCTLLESNSRKVESALLLAGNNPQIRVVESPENELISAFENLLETNIKTGMVVFSSVISCEIKQKTLEMCLDIQKERTVFIIERIDLNKEMRRFWKQIVKDKRIAVAFDLINLGILVVDPQLKKRSYKLFY